MEKECRGCLLPKLTSVSVLPEQYKGQCPQRLSAVHSQPDRARPLYPEFSAGDEYIENFVPLKIIGRSFDGCVPL